MIYNQIGHQVRIIGIDGGIELGQTSKPFFDDKFKVQIRTRGIIVFQTLPNILQMNSKIERAAGEVLEKTWSTLLAYYILEHLQPFVIKTVIQVINTLPTRANLDLQSLYEQFAIVLGMPESARKLYIRHFRAYFCEAYYYIKLQKRVQLDKFTVRAEKGWLISYADLYSKLY